MFGSDARTLRFLEAHIDEIPSFEGPSYDLAIPLSFVRKHRAKEGWDWDALTRKATNSLQTILDNPDLPWVLENYTYNPAVTIQEIRDHPDGVGEPWNWAVLSDNLPFSEIRKNMDLPWNWYHASDRADLDFVFAHPDFDWKWPLITKKCSLELIEQHPELPFRGCEFHPQLTVQFVERHSELNFEHMFPYNEALLRSFAATYPDKVANFGGSVNTAFVDHFWHKIKHLSRIYAEVSMDYLEQLPIRNEHYLLMSQNRALTVDFIKRHPGPWVWMLISPSINEQEKINHPDEPWTEHYFGSGVRAEKIDVIDQIESGRLSIEAIGWSRILDQLQTDIGLAKEWRDEKRQVPRVHDSVFYKVFLGSPIDKPIDYFPALLLKMALFWPVKGPFSPTERFVLATKKLPLELQILVCAMVYYQLDISVATLDSVLAG